MRFSCGGWFGFWNAVEQWQLQAQAMRAADHASSHHGIHESSQQPHHHLFSVDQLSRLSNVNRGGAVDQQQLQQGGVGGAAGTAHYDHHIQAETRVDGPKLEDFLGGTSLAGQYSDSGDHQSHHHHHHHQQQLDGLYYNAAAHGAASFQAESQSRINVNLPYTHSAGATIGSGSLRDLAPSSSTFHLTAYGSAVAAQQQQDQSSLALSHHLHHCYDHTHEHEQQLQENNLLAAARSRSHLNAQNLLQIALDQQQQQQQQQSDHGSLQMPAQNSTGLKSWLHHQADAADSKAGIVLQGVTQAARHSTSSLSSATALTSWQPLSLSMSAASSSSHAVTDHSVSKQQLMLPNSHHMAESSQAAAIVPEPRKRGVGRMGAGKDGPSPRKSIDTFGQRTSVYRGVTRYNNNLLNESAFTSTIFIFMLLFAHNNFVQVPATFQGHLSI